MPVWGVDEGVPIRERLESALRAAPLTVAAYADDVILMGVPEKVQEAITELRKVLADQADLVLNPAKSTVFSTEDVVDRIPAIPPANHTKDGITLNHTKDGMRVLGGFLGTKQYIREQLEACLEDTQDRIDKIIPLQDPHVAMDLLVFTVVPMMTHLLRTVPHESLLRPYCERFDAMTEEAAAKILRLPTGDALPIQWTAAQRIQLHLPARLGGARLQSAKTTLGAAIVASWLDVMKGAKHDPQDPNIWCRLNAAQARWLLHVDRQDETWQWTAYRDGETEVLVDCLEASSDVGGSPQVL